MRERGPTGVSVGWFGEECRSELFTLTLKRVLSVNYWNEAGAYRFCIGHCLKDRLWISLL